MYARLVEIQVAPGKMDDCIAIFRERNAPSIAAHPGFDHGHWFVDRRESFETVHDQRCPRELPELR